MRQPVLFSIDIEMSDIITTSEIELGVETAPVPNGNGAWEAL